MLCVCVYVCVCNLYHVAVSNREQYGWDIDLICAWINRLISHKPITPPSPILYENFHFIVNCIFAHMNVLLFYTFNDMKFTCRASIMIFAVWAVFFSFFLFHFFFCSEFHIVVICPDTIHDVQKKKQKQSMRSHRKKVSIKFASGWMVNWTVCGGRLVI